MAVRRPQLDSPAEDNLFVLFVLEQANRGLEVTRRNQSQKRPQNPANRVERAEISVEKEVCGK